MKKFMTALMVLSLVLAGVSLAAAADLPQTSKVADLNAVTKISDQEAQNISGTGGLGPNFGGFSGVCPNPTCVPQANSNLYLKNYSKTWLTSGLIRSNN